MNNHPSSQLFSASRHYNPTEGTSQVGYRAISGDIASSGERVQLRAWALVYPLCVVADSYYDLFVSLFAEVSSDGIIALPVDGIRAEKFADMSERVDLIGERATIWVTSMMDNEEKRGGVLAAVSDNLVHLLTLDSYSAVGRERAVYVLEAITRNTAERVAGLKLSPTADTMGRLPVLQDIVDLLDNTRVDASWYKVGEL
jgi:hypothetical protein